MKCDFLQTRILSVFNLLKRVGFALLLLGINAAGISQWSDNPQGHIRHSCGIYRVPAGISSICSDGLGGVFVTTGFSTSGWADERRYWLVHVNADGYLSLQGNECPDMIRVDEPNYGTDFQTGIVRLIPSEPLGTVIVLTERYLLDDFINPTFVGLVAVKYDSLGLSGFGRVQFSADTTLRLARRGYEGLWDLAGGWEGQSDLLGGVHLVMRHMAGGRYYNHLSSTGELRYQLPGVRMRGMYLHRDQTGGVFDFWWEPEQPSELHGQRFNAQGDSVFEAGGRTVTTQGEYQLNITLSANRILYRTSVETSGLVMQNVYLLDTNMVNQWEQGGRILRTDSANVFIGAILPDETGGFFHHQEVTDSTTIINRYDSEANHFASSAPEPRVISQSDGLGGGYYYEMQGKVWRWQPDMTPAWQDSIVVFDCTSCGSTRWTTVEEGGLIGLLSTSTGYAFYHVNLDGTLGPRTNVDEDGPTVPGAFRIVKAFPNPFNSTLSISLDVPLHQEVTVSLYDLLGREVDVVYRGRLSSQTISYVAPAALSSGVYFLRASANSQAVLKKVVLLK